MKDHFVLNVKKIITFIAIIAGKFLKNVSSTIQTGISAQSVKRDTQQKQINV